MDSLSQLQRKPESLTVHKCNKLSENRTLSRERGEVARQLEVSPANMAFQIPAALLLREAGKKNKIGG